MTYQGEDVTSFHTKTSLNKLHKTAKCLLRPPPSLEQVPEFAPCPLRDMVTSAKVRLGHDG